MNKNEYEMLLSLIDSIYKAGGNPKAIIPDLTKVTVAELIETLAPNGVRFHWEKSKND